MKILLARLKNSDDLELVAVFLLCVFLFGICGYVAADIKNTGLYGALAFTLVLAFRDFARVKNNFISNLKENKAILISAFSLFIVMLLTTAFPYDAQVYDFKDSYLYELFKDLKKELLFVFIALCVFSSKEKYARMVFVALALALAASNFGFIAEAVKGGVTFDDLFNKINGGAQIDRNFAFYFDMTFAFAFLALFVFRSVVARVLIFAFIVLPAVALNLFAGARGSWIAGFIAVILILFVLWQKKPEIFAAVKYKKALFAILALLVVFVSVESDFVKSRFDKSVSDDFTSQRDVILKTRLPVFFDSNRSFVGLGYGNRQYDVFFEKEFAKIKAKEVKKAKKSKKKPLSAGKLRMKHFGPFRVDKKDGKKVVRWLHDEPTLVAAYYHYGFIGTPIFAFMIFYLLYASYKRAKDNVLYLGLFGSMLAFYVIRGFFENLGTSFIFIMIGIFILLNYKKESAN